MRRFVIVRDLAIIIGVVLLLSIARHWIPWWWLLVGVLAYLSILAVGAIFIRLNFFLDAHHHGSRQGREIALSFDDGPGSHTAAILDILKAEAVPAAFFSIGKHAVQSPEVLKRWKEEGHLIGNHSYAHGFHFDWQGRHAMLAEIQKTNEAIHDAVGLRPRLFRPPYGVTNPELSHALHLAKMEAIGWSLRSFDTSAKDADALLQKLLQKVRGGDIILLHDEAPHTHSILTALIRGCREKGYTFVRLDQLLGVEPYA